MNGGINPQDSTLKGFLKGLGKSKFVYHSESHRDRHYVGVSSGINPQYSNLKGFLKGLGKFKFVYHLESHHDHHYVNSP